MNRRKFLTILLALPVSFALGNQAYAKKEELFPGLRKALKKLARQQRKSNGNGK